MFKVLIVDDEQAVIHGLCSQIDWELLNMELAGTATNGHDALNILTHTHIHLLITDVAMPQVDGLTLITNAKRMISSLRCIIISGYDDF